MIEIRESDFSWRMYRRFYNNVENPPHPRSLCRYFWRSVGGVVVSFLWDFPFLVTLAVLVPLVALSWSGASSFVDSQSVAGFFGFLFCGLAAVVVTGGAIMVTVERLHNYCVRTGREQVSRLLVAGVAILLVSVVVGDIWRVGLGGKDAPSHWWHALYGFLTLLAVGAAVIFAVGVYIALFTDSTRTGAQVAAYLRAVKDRACPLVKVPGDENVGSGREGGGG